MYAGVRRSGGSGNAKESLPQSGPGGGKRRNWVRLVKGEAFTCFNRAKKRDIPRYNTAHRLVIPIMMLAIISNVMVV
jgi:hypothetical protein